MRDFTRRTSTRRLAAQTRSVGEVFSSEQPYRIPYYQRHYAWTSEEARTLLTDIRSAQARSAEALDVSLPYFLGPLVVACAVGDDSHSIVDGHQRLTTLTIMLSIMRDLDPGGAERLGGFVLRSDWERRGPLSGILMQRPLDLEFFYHHFQRPGATAELSEDIQVDNDAQGRMVQTALALRSELERSTPSARVWLADFILRSCDFVEVVAPDDEQAYQVFMSINWRGKDLNDKDLLKAEVIGHISTPRRPRFAYEWESLEASLGDEQFIELFHHIDKIHNPTKSFRSTALEIRESLNPAADPEAFITEEVQPKGRAMIEILKEEVVKTGAHVDESKKLLRSLMRVNHRDWLSVAIAFFSKTKRRGDEAVAFLRELERQTYVILFQAGDENVRWARYGKVINMIQEGRPTEEILPELDATHFDRVTCRQVLDRNIYRKEHLRKAVLLRIDEHMSGGVARYDLPNVSVEHVLPRNVPQDSAWLENFPNPEYRKRWVDRLGNLALLNRSINETAGNLDFDRKKEEYFPLNESTPFAITTQIMREQEWTPAVIERRQKMLLDIACKIWRI